MLKSSHFGYFSKLMCIELFYLKKHKRQLCIMIICCKPVKRTAWVPCTAAAHHRDVLIVLYSDAVEPNVITASNSSSSSSGSSNDCKPVTANVVVCMATRPSVNNSLWPASVAAAAATANDSTSTCFLSLWCRVLLLQ